MPQDEATQLFNAAIWPHAASVMRTARCVVRDPAEAEDIAQETMFKAFRSVSTFRQGTNALAWLMSILRSVRIDRSRAAARTVPSVNLDELGAEPAGAMDTGGNDDDPVWDDPDALLEAFSDRDVIAALHRLPEEIRWTLLLVEIEGLDHEAAAPVLGVPVGTIKSRAHRGRAMLRSALLPLAVDRRLVRNVDAPERGTE